MYTVFLYSNQRRHRNVQVIVERNYGDSEMLVFYICIPKCKDFANGIFSTRSS